MGPTLSFDTSFLIDFQRERRRRSEGAAHRYLKMHLRDQPAVSVVALAEFAEGFSDERDPLVNWVRNTHRILDVDEKTALIYGRITRNLRAGGRLIGTNDLWIAAAALRHQIPVVTGNEAHFSRIPALDVRTYR